MAWSLIVHINTDKNCSTALQAFSIRSVSFQVHNLGCNVKGQGSGRPGPPARNAPAVNRCLFLAKKSTTTVQKTLKCRWYSNIRADDDKFVADTSRLSIITLNFIVIARVTSYIYHIELFWNIIKLLICQILKIVWSCYVLRRTAIKL